MKVWKRNSLIAALTLISAAALAYQEVTVNGLTYGCENRCNVTTYPGGGYLIRDTLGGYVNMVPR
jgi:predicted S18 family serine protease